MQAVPIRAVAWHARQAASFPVERHLDRLKHLSADDYRSLQLRYLRRRYDDAVRNVPYYRETSTYPRRLPNGDDVYEVLGALPLLNKQVVKERTSDFWRHPPSPLVSTHTTGGTTGTPLRVRASAYERLLTHAIVGSSYRALCGLGRSPRIVNLSGFLGSGATGDPLWWRMPSTGSAFLSIYRLSPADKDEIAARLEEFRPEAFYGYASAIVQLATLFPARELGEVAAIPCITTSETLSPDQRRLIEANLGSEVHNQYGSQEGQHFSLECREGSMHIHPRRGIVEILALDESRPARAGELGRVVVTGLANRNMPLMRYSIGDTALATGFHHDCVCGLAWPTIGQVYGRTEDLVLASDGRKIGLLSHATSKDLPDIIESQLVQTGYGTFKYRLRVQAHADVSQIERHVEGELSRRLGESVSIQFEYVDSLERTAAGKVQAVVVQFEE